MKRRQRRGAMVRLVSRVAVTALALLVFTLVGIQFARIIGENVAMARSLASVQRDVATLRIRRVDQERELRRLRDPRGTIPDIHQRLHLVGPHEAIVFIKPAPR